MNVYPLELGKVDLDQRVIMPASPPGARITVPVPAYLIELDGGQRVLIDTGMPLEALRAPETLGERMRPVGGEPAYVATVLDGLGFPPATIGYVVATHFHFDHAGGLDAFAHASIVAQRRAVEAARKGSVWERRLVEACQGAWRLVDGDTELFPGVRLIETSGHTIGHQSVLIDTGRHKLLLAIDAIYTNAQYEAGDWGAYVDKTAAVVSAEKVRALAEAEQARLIFGHDVPQWKTLRHAPECYD